MTDNDLRKSRHWRCSQCGSSWPLDMAVCGNPACGADLGIYGQVIEPEPERAPEPEKKPPSPEDEKPKDEQKKEPKREKPKPSPAAAPSGKQISQPPSSSAYRTS